MSRRACATNGSTYSEWRTHFLHRTDVCGFDHKRFHSRSFTIYTTREKTLCTCWEFYGMGKKFNDQYLLVMFSYWKQCFVQNRCKIQDASFKFPTAWIKSLAVNARFSQQCSMTCLQGTCRTTYWMTSITFTLFLNKEQERTQRGLPGCNHFPIRFKKHKLCRKGGIKLYTWFTLQAKSTTWFGWILVHCYVEK
jgi:hypothetical protein